MPKRANTGINHSRAVAGVRLAPQLAGGKPSTAIEGSFACGKVTATPGFGRAFLDLVIQGQPLLAFGAGGPRIEFFHCPSGATVRLLEKTQYSLSLSQTMLMGSFSIGHAKGHDRGNAFEKLLAFLSAGVTLKPEFQFLFVPGTALAVFFCSNDRPLGIVRTASGHCHTSK